MTTQNLEITRPINVENYEELVHNLLAKQSPTTNWFSDGSNDFVIELTFGRFCISAKNVEGMWKVITWVFIPNNYMGTR